MSFGRLRTDPRPLHEQEERVPRLSLVVVGVLSEDLDAVGKAVRSFERRRAVVPGHITAAGVRVPFGVIRRTELAGHQFFRLPTISRITLPVMNATFAGRSASRRIRYGYHCVPNGT